MKYIFAIIIVASNLYSCTKPADEELLPPDESIIAKSGSFQDTLPGITGIGGIFFKSENPDATSAWYADNLGLKTDPYGAVFEFRNANRPNEQNYLRWSPMTDTTTYFQPSGKNFMINYRVRHIEALVEKMKANGVTVVDTITEFEYGKFVHILDPEGNAIELWEPVDSVLTKMGGPTNR